MLTFQILLIQVRLETYYSCKAGTETRREEYIIFNTVYVICIYSMLSVGCAYVCVDRGVS